MKKVILSTLISLFTVLVYAQNPRAYVYVEGSQYRENHKSTIELVDLLQSESLLVWKGANDTSIYSIESAQFIFAPWRGEANLVKINGPKFPESVKTILRNRAQAGDRIIIDRIRVRVNGESVTFIPFLVEILVNDTFIRPIEVSWKHNFSEDSLASDEMEMDGKISSVEVTTTSSSSNSPLVRDTFHFNSVSVSGDGAGQIQYYNQEGSLVSRATFKDSVLLHKEYYFEGQLPNQVRSSLDLVNGVYHTKHYNLDGYLVAEGNVLEKDRSPFSMKMDPVGFKDSPFQSISVITEYPANGPWRIYNTKGEITSEFVLVAGLSSFQSAKKNQNSKSIKSAKTKRKNRLKRNQPQKYKPLITPSF